MSLWDVLGVITIIGFVFIFFAIIIEFFVIILLPIFSALL